MEALGQARQGVRKVSVRVGPQSSIACLHSFLGNKSKKGSIFQLNVLTLSIIDEVGCR